MTKTFIGIVPNLESTQIVIAPGKTMNEAIEFAQKIFGFKGNHLEKAEGNNDAWIGTMNQSDYYFTVSEILNILLASNILILESQPINAVAVLSAAIATHNLLYATAIDVIYTI